MFYLQIALLGIIYGGLYALSATGIVITYTATGVFNIAHFSIALLAGYLGWQLNGVWGLPLLVTVPLVLILCGPLLGLVLERTVFRPLQRSRASSSEKLVAALGVTVVVLALIVVLWGPGVQGTTDKPVPRLFGLHPFDIGSLYFDTEQVGTLAVVVAVAAALYLLLRHTFLGVQIRAVVDRRELAELSAIDANRVSRVAWTLGCTLAAITGLIIPQGTLEPTRIIFLGIETFSVAVVARLVSIPVAIGFGFFVMGLGRSLLDIFEPFGSTGGWAETYQAIVTNLSSIVLFLALVAFRRLDEVGETAPSSRGLVGGSVGRRAASLRSSPFALAVTGLALLAPFLLDGVNLRRGHTMLALAVIFVSIVCITGFSGHLTLGQASIAGIGAFFSARAANSLDLPVLLAMLVGALVAMGAGLLAGYPALRRKGLFLGLTTLALALIIDRFVFNAELFQGGPGGLTVRRPSLFGFDLTGDTAFYFYELAVVGIVLFFARNLRSGRLGRVLGAMRDSETATQSVGIGLRRAKLFVFAVSSAIAGIGGALLTQTQQNWDTFTFNPVLGLFWFTAVIVCGIDSVRGALLAAFLYVALPAVLDLEISKAIGLFGIGATFLGYLPGGLAALPDRIGPALRGRLAGVYRSASSVADPAVEPLPALVPTPFAEQVLAEPVLAERVLVDRPAP